LFSFVEIFVEQRV